MENIEGGCKMKVPFLDLKQQWLNLKEEIKPEILKVFESGVFIGGGILFDL